LRYERLKTVRKTFFILVMLSSYVSVAQWSMDQIETYERFDDFEHLLHLESDTTYLINFWATWCGPCVKELPYIDDLVETYENKKYKSILVSLDFKNQLESRLVPFLNKNKIKSDVVVLLDGKSSKWIDRVDPSWSGAIPITIVYNGNKKLFFEQQFHSIQELTEIIDPFFNDKN